MIDGEPTMNRPSTRRRSPARSSLRGGFTLVELLMVIVIIAILISLLLPVIGGALRQAKRAAVSAEISQLNQALASFKSKYGAYPPSRFLAVEYGDYTNFLNQTTVALTASTPIDPTSPGDGDITMAQLAQRSVAALRQFWPRVNTATGNASTVLTYDFNGNNTADGAYILHGHECLVFFLGGIPAPTTVPVTPATTFGMIGFDKNPQNPFTNIVVNPTNRQPPLFEFSGGRLFVDPFSSTGIPGYFDSLGNITPQAGGVPTTLNFYVYFSAYGSNGYDPNDANFYNSAASTWLETDNAGNGPIGLGFTTNFGTMSSKAVNHCESYTPNPYTGTFSVGTPVTWLSPQSFQIISSGIDGLYGVGGQVLTNPTVTAVSTIPPDGNNTFYGSTNGGTISSETDATIRYREQDNLTSFKSGTLQ
jgi:prepilin-type N-terminal cleavage/methylation domain-containing protein